MPDKWDAALELKLLQCVIEVADVKALSWGDVCAKMGSGYTKESCRQRFAKLKKAAAKFGQSTTPNVTPPKAAAPAMVPKTRKAALRSAKSTKAAGTKRKRAESVDVSNHDSEEDRATASVNDKDDEIPKKKVKAEPKGRQMEIIKTKEKLADGSLDLAQDSLHE